MEIAMEKIKFSVFDIFAYIIPGTVVLLAVIVFIDPLITRLIDLTKLFQNIDLGVGLALIVAAYIIGFAVDSPASWLYYSIGCRVFGPPYKPAKNGLSNPQKRALVRHFSPENYSYIQLWKVIKTMSHNLSLSTCILAVVFTIRAFQIPAYDRTEWIVLSVVTFLLSVIFLHRAHVFDTWHYKDLSSTVQALHLEERAVREAISSPEKDSAG
jgi:hypothetical protein